jgi:hypothetical protein
MSEIKFRRIHGRVIPIGKKRQEDIIKGTVATTAGAAIGVVAGNKSAEMLHQSANLANEARKLAKLSKKITVNTPTQAAYKRYFAKRVIGIGVQSEQLRRSSKLIKHGGLALSSAIIGAGVSKLVSDKDKKKSETKKTLAFIGGAAASFAVQHAFLRGVGNRGFAPLKMAINKILKVK